MKLFEVTGSMTNVAAALYAMREIPTETFTTQMLRQHLPKENVDLGPVIQLMISNKALERIGQGMYRRGDPEWVARLERDYNVV